MVKKHSKLHVFCGLKHVKILKKKTEITHIFLVQNSSSIIDEIGQNQETITKIFSIILQVYELDFGSVFVSFWMRERL